MLQVEKATIDTSFRLHGEFYAKICSKGFLWNAWNVLKRMRTKRKKDRSCTSQVGMFKSLPVPNSLILHKSYGFNDDLIEAIN